jgi:hypothetical protein
MDEFERAAAAFPDLDDTFSPGISQPTGGGGASFPALDDEDDFGMPTTAPSNLGVGFGDADNLDEFDRAASAFPALDGDEGPANAPSLEVCGTDCCTISC